MKPTNALATCLFLFASFAGAAPSDASTDWRGAWERQEDGDRHVLLVFDGYWTQSSFDAQPPVFRHTFGGPLAGSEGAWVGTIHFDSADAERVGKPVALQATLEGPTLKLAYDDGPALEWRRIDEAGTPLAGVWRISGRQRGGELQEMPLRARRTLKTLTGSRFQWIAMNIETGEFSGTGGGRYTFEDGVYTEIIEFFSRDNARVGATLAFEGELRDGDWHHSGLSSRGEPIYEVWTKVEDE